MGLRGLGRTMGNAAGRVVPRGEPATLTPHDSSSSLSLSTPVCNKSPSTPPRRAVCRRGCRRDRHTLEKNQLLEAVEDGGYEATLLTVDDDGDAELDDPDVKAAKVPCRDDGKIHRKGGWIAGCVAEWGDRKTPKF